MPLPVKNYYSTQAISPPQLSGTAGSLIAVLDAALVTGFGNVGISSIAVAANVATVTTATNHGLAAGDNLVISGANEVVFNDEFFVKAVIGSTTFTLDCVTGLTAATGTLALKIAPLGWEKVFSGTNLAVYRSTDPDGTRLYLRVNDTEANLATATMYETMTDVNTGTGQSADVYWPKSNTSGSREWHLIGDRKRFYFLPAFHSTYPTLGLGCVFGDLNSYKVGDAYHCMLIGGTTTDWDSLHAAQGFSWITSPGSFSGGQLLARTHTQLGGAVAFTKVAGGLLSPTSGSQFGYSTGLATVNPADNGIHLLPVLVFETNSLRGTLPGIYAPLESIGATFSNRDALPLSGKTYRAYRIMGAVPIGGGAALAAGSLFDISGPW